MLKDDIKARMLAAMKERDEVAKSAYRVALGEVQSKATTKGRDLTDDEVVAILRKLIKSNEECLAAGPDEARQAVYERENALLADLLPKTLSVEEIQAALEPVKDAVLGAKNDGQATGVAMKHLKSTGAAVTGQEVARAVRDMRA